MRTIRVVCAYLLILSTLLPYSDQHITLVNNGMGFSKNGTSHEDKLTDIMTPDEVFKRGNANRTWETDRVKSRSALVDLWLKSNLAELHEFVASVSNATFDADKQIDIMAKLDEILKTLQATAPNDAGTRIVMQAISKITSCCIDQLEAAYFRPLFAYTERAVSGVSLTDKGYYNFKSSHITQFVRAVTAAQVDSNGRIPYKMVYILYLVQDYHSSINVDGVSVSIEIPFDSVIKSLSDAEKSKVNRIGMTVYRDDTLFRDNLTNSPPAATGNVVISVSLPEIAVKNMTENIVLVFPRHDETSPECVSWRYDAGRGNYKWDTGGCSVIGIGRTFVKCVCNHLTSITLRETQKLKNTISIPSCSNIGTALSAIALLITILTYTLFPELRENKRYIIVLNVCFALIMGIVLRISNLSLVSPNYHEHVLLCKMNAMLLHLFMISSLTWLTSDSYYAFISLQGSIDETDDTPFRTIAVVSWFIPIVLVLLTLVLPPLDNYSYVSSFQMCWIRCPAVYIALVLPFVLIMLCNVIIFGSVFCRVRRTITSYEQYPRRFIILMKQIIGSGLLIFLLIVTWLLGIFQFGNAKFIMSCHVFDAVYSLLGFFAFIFFCVMNPMVMDIFKGLIVGNKKQPPDHPQNTPGEKATPEEKATPAET